MRVLWHLSHTSSSRPDGWSGAPDEARWVREDLTPRVRAAAWALGITIIVVPGDLQDHIEFHEDYDAFVAPHYEANIHGEGGAFWGRAAASLTAAQDDRLGTIFWRRYRALAGCPPDRFAWTNANVTDYYGFRLTTAKTPGILVEHGVGWRLPEDYDYTWLRQNAQPIADTWALALAEFGVVPAGPRPSTPRLEDDMTPEQERKLDRVLELLEAREPLVWAARGQRFLDIETGKPFDPNTNPLDARIRK